MPLPARELIFSHWAVATVAASSEMVVMLKKFRHVCAILEILVSPVKALGANNSPKYIS